MDKIFEMFKEYDDKLESKYQLLFESLKIMDIENEIVVIENHDNMTINESLNLFHKSVAKAQAKANKKAYSELQRREAQLILGELSTGLERAIDSEHKSAIMRTDILPLFKRSLGYALKAGLLSLILSPFIAWGIMLHVQAKNELGDDLKYYMKHKDKFIKSFKLQLKFVEEKIKEEEYSGNKENVKSLEKIKQGLERDIVKIEKLKAPKKLFESVDDDDYEDVEDDEDDLYDDTEDDDNNNNLDFF